MMPSHDYSDTCVGERNIGATIVQRSQNKLPCVITIITVSGIKPHTAVKRQIFLSQTYVTFHFARTLCHQTIRGKIRRWSPPVIIHGVERS